MRSLPLPHLRARDVAGYVFLPRIIPRLREASFRFSYVAHLMAIIYHMVGLLPAHHPYLQPKNYGTFSVRQVFIAAGAHLIWSRQYLDRIIIYFLLASAFALLAIQFVLMAIYLVMGFAYAAAPYTGMFSTPDPTNDIAFIFLDRVFGVPGFFNSCISTTATCESTGQYLVPTEPLVFPTPEQVAVQSLFAFYSTGIMVVGGLIIAFFISTLAMETAETGVPFGKRFANVYAPMRLCLAVLAIIPLPLGGGGQNANILGYNAAQYLVLYVAKTGSSMGTNTWNIFNNYFLIGGAGTSAPPAGTNAMTVNVKGNSPATELIALPRLPDINPTLQFMHLSHACRAMMSRGHRKTPDVFLIRSGGVEGDPRTYIRLNEIREYKKALEFTRGGSLFMRMGLENTEKKQIDPLCGDLALRVGDQKQPGGKWLQEQYFAAIQQMWRDPVIIAFGDRVARIYIEGSEATGNRAAACSVTIPDSYNARWGLGEPACAQLPNADYYLGLQKEYKDIFIDLIKRARDEQITATNATLDPKIFSRGWAGAGVWYNRLAQLNGALFEAANGMPDLKAMPVPMEKIQGQRIAGLEAISQINKYLPQGNKETEMVTAYKDVASGLNQVKTYFDQPQFNAEKLQIKDNVIFAVINDLFGTDIMFDMRSNMDVNPLVQMIALGKSMVDATLTVMVSAAALEFGGGALKKISGQGDLAGGLLKISDALFDVSMISLGIGIMLYYIIPFLPFIYFFFAVVKWMQSIFEAMISMPLWALAHLRVDGDGIPGEAAGQGYFLLFEIFIRPTLAIFGMVASYAMFTGTVYMITDLFNAAIPNFSGQDMGSAFSRGAMEYFLYTIVYVILVYMLALSSFKLIDQIPENILRWMGSDVKNVIDEMGDPAPDLIKSVYMGAFGAPVLQKSSDSVIGRTVEGLQKTVQGMGGLAGEVMEQGMKKPEGPKKE